MATKSCSGCLQVIKNRQFLSCCTCGGYYDIQCANVSENRFRNTLTGEHRLNWKCAACISREPRGDNSDTPVRGHDDKVTRHRGAAVKSPVEGRSPLATFEVGTSGDGNTSIIALTERLDLLVEEIRGFRQELVETRHQVQAFDGKLSGLVTQVETCVSGIRELKSRVEKLESRTEVSAQSHCAHDTLKDTIESLKIELNERDQELLLNDVEFTCIPEQKERGFATHCHYSGEQDWCDTGARRRGLAPIVVRLVRRALRDDLLRAARVRRTVTTDGVGLPGAPGRFYVNERLTRANRALFRQAREAGRRHGWRFIWTRDGRIFARQHPGPDASRHRLRTQSDLDRIFGPSAVGSPVFNSQ
ncbi:hypothetical protein ACJJTC_005808 [Scirpophaga incertulas]